MNQVEQIINDNDQNNNISSKEFIQQEDYNNQNEPTTQYQKIYQIKKNVYINPSQKKVLNNNNPHYITQTLTKKIIQNNNNLNVTPINQDSINLNYTCPNQNQIIANNNSNSFINRTNNTVALNSYNNINYDINKDYEPLTDDNEKLNELAKNIKENENKIDKINKTMNEIILSKNKSYELNDMKSFFTQINDIENIKQENITLKADTIIYREDINNLIDLNNKYTEELELSRKKILDLISRNNDIEKYINHKDYQINKLNEVLTRLRLYDNSDMEYKIKNNQSKEEILHEIEFKVKVANEENIKLNTEKKILQEKIKNIIDNKKELNRNIILNNEQNSKIINEMEDRIKILENQINEISNENVLLNINNQKSEKEIQKLYEEKCNCENKYNKTNEEYQKLQYDYSKLNKKYQQLLNENNRNLILEKNKKMDNEKKLKKDNKNAINELYNKIQILKSKVKSERDIEY